MEQSNFDRTKTIHFRLAEPGSFYDGHVMRIVTRDLGGVLAEVSATTTGKSLSEFQKENPGTVVGGIRADSLEAEIAKMSDEQLAAWGLKRESDPEMETAPAPEPEHAAKPTVTFPLHRGFGRWECSDGTMFDTKGEPNKDLAAAYEMQLKEDAELEEMGDDEE